MKGIAAFILLTFGLSWGIWEALIGDGWIPGNASLSTAVLYGAFAPALAAFAVRILVTREGFVDGVLRFNFRKWKYYFIAWLLPLPVVAFVLYAARAFGLAEVDFTFRSGLAALAGTSESGQFLHDISPLMLIANSLAMSVPSMFILFGEEFGWRGFLQRRLFAGKPLAAAVVTGLLWSLWHLPLNMRGYNFPDDPALGMVVFSVTAILLSIIFGWLVERSGSVWTACLAHSSTNAVGASLVVLACGGKQTLTVGYFGLLGWVPLGLLAAWIVFTGRLAPARSAETAETAEAA